MPTYVYRREDGTTFELFQRITDDALSRDPETGQKIERVISGGVGLQFKGTGFYLTDYARSGSNGQATDVETSGESSTDGKPEAKPEANSDIKPEVKSSTKSDSKSDAKGTDASGSSPE